MTDMLALQVGCPPWRPANNVTAVDVLHRYDGPLIGIVEQDGVHFLFQCLIGHVDEGQAWIYAHLTEGEREMLLRTEGAEEMDAAINHLLEGRTVQAALATDEGGIRFATNVAHTGVVITTMRAVTNSLRREIDRIERVETLLEALPA